MRLRVDRTPQARLDIIEAAKYIALNSARSSREFIQAAARTFAVLARSPGIGRTVDLSRPSLRGLRVWPVEGFRNYLVFYQVEGKCLVVTRVLHGARDLPAIIDS